jgi:tetratricopeptide (TPR) repeat protein
MLTSGLQLWLQPIVLGLLLLAASTRLLLLAPIVALEPVGLGTAVQRSWTLSRGAFGRIFIAMLICSCIGGVLIALPMLASELVLGDAASEESSAIVRSLGPLGSRLAEVFIFPIPVIALTLLYYGQRFRHEGYDLDMLLQRETAAAVQAMIKPLATGEGLSDPQSLPILNAALECDPLHPQARYFRSWVRHETGDQQGALEDIALVVQRYSHDPHTLLLRAAIYWTLGDVAAAGRDVMQINRMRPEMVRELEQSATDAFTRGNLALSLTYLNRMLLLAPTSAWAHYNRACVLARQHAGDEALASLRTAISYDPQWRTQAVDDADLTSLRDDPRFGALLSAK